VAQANCLQLRECTAGGAKQCVGDAFFFWDGKLATREDILSEVDALAEIRVKPSLLQILGPQNLQLRQAPEHVAEVWRGP